MKLPINWLKEYIDVDNPQEVIEKMTSIGHMQDGPPKKVEDDLVYDLEVRQNRPDCLSIIGLAREAAAAMNKKLNNTLSNLSIPSNPSTPSSLKLSINEPSLCYRFNTLVIDGLKIGTSPDWIIKRLVAYGIKPINNVVDITNYVMVEVGEPLHAFDVRDIENKEVILRRAKKNETITVIGNKKIELTEDDLVVSDNNKPLALAGIIGGEETGVKNDTITIVLEAATYNQATIRRSSIRHSLRTEASMRHEKFLHPHLSEVGLKRAAQLIKEICKGEVTAHIDCYPNPIENKPISLSLNSIEKVGSVQISTDKILSILNKLEIEVVEKSETDLSVIAPYFRTDLLQEADIVEEVLRMYGYGNIPEHLPSLPPPKHIQSKSYDFEEEIRNIMVACGFDEEITEPLTRETNPKLKPVILENSLSSEKTMLRTTLKESLMKAYSEQLKYRKSEIKIFEVGRIYFKEDDSYKEQKVIGGLSYYKDNSYFHVKGTTEILFEKLNREYDKSIVEIEMINETTFFFQVNTDEMLKQKKVTKRKVLSTPPQLNLQDFSFIVAVETPVGNILEEIVKSSNLIYKVTLGEEPKVLDDNNKTVFLHVAFQSPDKTLTNEDVEPERQKIIKLLTDKFQAKLR